jgi:gas vesicle protein
MAETIKITDDEAEQKNPNGVAKKSKRGLILGLSIGGGVLFIGAIVTLLIVLLGGLSKKDWQNAQAKAAAVYQTYSDKGSAITSDVSDMTSSLSDKSADLQSKVSTVSSDITSFRSALKDNITALGNEKAIKQDKNAQDKFAKLNSAYKKYDDTLAEASVIYTKVLPLFVKMGQLNNNNVSSTSDAAAIAGQFTSLASDFAAVHTGYPSVDNSLQKISTDLKNMGDGLTTMLTDTSSSTSLTKIQTAASSLESDASGLQSVMEGTDITSNETAFTGSLNSLQDYIATKIK